MKKQLTKKQRENLKKHSFNKRTASELQEITKRGGVNSGISRNKDKSFKDLINIISTTQLNDNKLTKELKEKGLDTDYRNIIIYKLMQKGIYKGNIDALKKLIDIFSNADTDTNLIANGNIRNEILIALNNDTDLWNGYAMPSDNLSTENLQQN